MDMWKLESLELLADAMEEVREWADYEADMAEMREEAWGFPSLPYEIKYNTKGEKKMFVYVLEKFDSLSGRYRYLNSFTSFKEAAEERDRLNRFFKGQYRVEMREV